MARSQQSLSEDQIVCRIKEGQSQGVGKNIYLGFTSKMFPQKAAPIGCIHIKPAEFITYYQI